MPPASRVADVDRLADQRMAALGQVDADLVGLAGLEPHLAQRRAAQRLERRDVGDRALALVRRCGVEPRRPSPRSATSIDSMRRGVDRAVRDAQVRALDRVRAQLRRQRRPRRAWSWRTSAGPRSRGRSGARRGAARVGRRLAHAPPRAADQVHRGAGLALLVRHARDARRLVDHHHVRRRRGRCTASRSGSRGRGAAVRSSTRLPGREPVIDRRSRTRRRRTPCRARSSA